MKYMAIGVDGQGMRVKFLSGYTKNRVKKQPSERLVLILRAGSLMYLDFYLGTLFR